MTIETNNKPGDTLKLKDWLFFTTLAGVFIGAQIYLIRLLAEVMQMKSAILVLIVAIVVSGYITYLVMRNKWKKVEQRFQEHLKNSKSE